MEKSTSASRSILIQDVGILLFALAMLGASLVTGLTDKTLVYQNAALLLAMTLSALLTGLRARVAGTVVTALTILVFTVYKLYNRIAYAVPIEWTAYLWPVLLVMALGGVTMFVALFATIEGLNGVLNRRLDELTVMDPVTGLENLRSMVNSLKRYMALSERNGTSMGLMIVRLRYSDEIRKVLTRQQFSDLRHLLAAAVQNALRLEDRVFTIDENASLGIIYFSLESGAPIVKNRILTVVQKEDMLPTVEGQVLNVEVSVVYKQYDSAYGKDAMRFISDVEKEFAYEV
ncbi:MAG: GGDEF domain-containing protein [Clostridia bacterium]|nr:GGDEF domain-containing protein [Clostridia bacterium]